MDSFHEYLLDGPRGRFAYSQLARLGFFFSLPNVKVSVSKVATVDQLSEASPHPIPPHLPTPSVSEVLQTALLAPPSRPPPPDPSLGANEVSTRGCLLLSLGLMGANTLV